MRLFDNRRIWGLTLRPTLDWNAERGRNQQIVVNAAALLELHSVIHAYEDIALLADQQHAWLWSVGQHLEHHEVGTRTDGAVRLWRHRQVGDHVTQVARAEHRGLQQREGAIDYHRPAFAIDQANRI